MMRASCLRNASRVHQSVHRSSVPRWFTSARPQEDWSEEYESLPSPSSDATQPPQRKTSFPATSNFSTESTWQPSPTFANSAATTPKNIVEGKEHVTAHQPSELLYAGDQAVPITSKLNIVTPEQDSPRGIWPAFRLMDESGYFRQPSLDGRDEEQTIYLAPQASSLDANEDSGADTLGALRAVLASQYPDLAQELAHNCRLLQPDLLSVTNEVDSLKRVHTTMARLRAMDTILLNAQRQGRISFYLTCAGEEAIMIGAASALETGDPLLVQYREQGMLMWRGFSLKQFCHQCFGTNRDLGKGRQMPIHYGSRALNYHTVASPLGTQLPQAVGAAYRLRLAGEPHVAVAVFGEGAASTPDFHSALNMAATTQSPTLFICRNNGYAISTSTRDQYKGDGIVVRAPGYGMAAVRVDGNDVFAVHAAVREAKAYALAHNAPVLIECLTYRQGHHSTSDDSTQYRSLDEIEAIQPMDPLVRLEAFLQKHGVRSRENMDQVHLEEREAVLQALSQAELAPKVGLDTLFTDVYEELTPALKGQQADLERHLKKYPEQYQ